MIDALVTALGIGVGIVVGIVALKLLAFAVVYTIVATHEWRQPDDVTVFHELDATDGHTTTHAVEGEWEFDVGDRIRYPPTGGEKAVIGRVYDVDDEECRYVYRSDDREYWIQARGWAEHDHELKDDAE